MQLLVRAEEKKGQYRLGKSRRGEERMGDQARAGSVHPLPPRSRFVWAPTALSSTALDQENMSVLKGRPLGKLGRGCVYREAVA